MLVVVPSVLVPVLAVVLPVRVPALVPVLAVVLVFVLPSFFLLLLLFMGASMKVGTHNPNWARVYPRAISIIWNVYVPFLFT